MVETHKTIARHGGWKVWSPLNGKLLQDPYRNHVVEGTAGAETYLLPPMMQGVGRGLPIGSLVHVFNVNGGSHSVTVENEDGTFSNIISANTMTSYLLTGSVAGITQWRTFHVGRPTGATAAVPSGFLFDLDVYTHRNNLRLLTEAVAAGYDGTTPALVKLRIHSGVVIGSTTRLNASLDLGDDAPVSGISWASGSLVLLTMDPGSWVSGYGGSGGGGGVGGTGGSTGIAGEDGGPALRTTIDVVIANAGVIQGGGGGGGGGNGQASIPGLHGGGGGGGAGANISSVFYVSGGAGGTAPTGALPGFEGLLNTPGGPGLGSVKSPNVGGRGGAGGGPAAAGLSGRTVNDTGAGSPGGAPGAAISRASGASVTFLTGASGTVVGATVVV